jgi:hypothetical protein
MPIQQTYYLDGPDLQSSTSVFLDIAQTICAPDGYYSDGVIFRQLQNCILLPVEQCEECGAPCTQPADPLFYQSGGEGIYRAPINVGSGVGAIIVEFDIVDETTDGILVNYNSLQFDSISTPVYGFFQSAIGGPTFIGDKLVCDPGGTHILNEYEWDGTTFNLTPVTSVVTVNNSQQLLDTGAVFPTGAPGKGIMVIPKLTPTPNTIEAVVYSTCKLTEFQIAVRCPELLQPIYSTIPTITPELSCEQIIDQTYYVASVTGTYPQLGMHDWVFTDPYGQNYAPDGWYNAPGHLLAVTHTCFKVISGVIVEFQTVCPSTFIDVSGKDQFSGLSGCNVGGIQSATMYLDWEPGISTVSWPYDNYTAPIQNGSYLLRLVIDIDPTSSNCTNLEVALTLVTGMMAYADNQTFIVTPGGQIFYQYPFTVNAADGPYTFEVDLNPI